MRTRSQLLLFTLALLGTTLLATAQGINFRTESPEKVFAEAKAQKMPVFVEIYSPTCHTCESFIPILNHPNVGKFYNANFISTKLDVGLPQTQAWLKQHKLFVPSIPLFLFFEPDGKLMHYALTKNDIQMVNQVAATALSPQKRAANLEKSYRSGNRDLSLLVDVAMWGKITLDTALNVAPIW